MAGCASCGGGSSKINTEPIQRTYKIYDPATGQFTDNKVVVSKPAIKKKP